MQCPRQTATQHERVVRLSDWMQRARGSWERLTSGPKMMWIWLQAYQEPRFHALCFAPRTRVIAFQFAGRYANDALRSVIPRSRATRDPRLLFGFPPTQASGWTGRFHLTTPQGAKNNRRSLTPFGMTLLDEWSRDRRKAGLLSKCVCPGAPQAMEVRETTTVIYCE